MTPSDEAEAETIVSRGDSVPAPPSILDTYRRALRHRTIRHSHMCAAHATSGRNSSGHVQFVHDRVFKFCVELFQCGECKPSCVLQLHSMRGCFSRSWGLTFN